MSRAGSLKCDGGYVIRKQRLPRAEIAAIDRLTAIED